MRIIFAGTPEPALPSLQRLIDSPHHDVVAVLTRPDAASGRRGRPAPSPVASVALELRALGVRRGDRVAAYLPNVPETIVAFLACSSIGAVWSVCAPDMAPPPWSTASARSSRWC